MQNAQRNLGSLYNKTFSEAFTLSMYSVDDEEQFEFSWQKMLKLCFPNGSHPWIKKIYRLRTQWSSAWLRQCYTAGMRSTQLAESVNGSVRGYLQSDHRLYDFFLHFDRMISTKRNAEREQEFIARDRLPNNYFPNNPIVKSAAAVYTPTVLSMFQDEYQHSFAYIVASMGHVGTDKLAYRVYEMEDSGSGVLDERVVHVGFENVCLACTCRLYEMLGLLCRHVLRVMEFLSASGHTEMRQIPPQYIKSRWTKAAKTGALTTAVTSARPTEYAMRYQALCTKMVKLAASVSMNDSAYDVLDSQINGLCVRIQEIMSNSSPQAETGVNATCETPGIQLTQRTLILVCLPS